MSEGNIPAKVTEWAVTAPADDKSTQAENERICEKLLGWERMSSAWPGPPRWNDKTLLGSQWPTTPTFTTWAEAGLILEAMINRGLAIEMFYNPSAKQWEVGDVPIAFECQDESGPLAIRAAALAYLRSMER